MCTCSTWSSRHGSAGCELWCSMGEVRPRKPASAVVRHAGPNARLRWGKMWSMPHRHQTQNPGCRHVRQPGHHAAVLLRILHGRHAAGDQPPGGAVSVFAAYGCRLVTGRQHPPEVGGMHCVTMCCQRFDRSKFRPGMLAGKLTTTIACSIGTLGRRVLSRRLWQQPLYVSLGCCSGPTSCVIDSAIIMIVHGDNPFLGMQAIRSTCRLQMQTSSRVSIGFMTTDWRSHSATFTNGMLTSYICMHGTTEPREVCQSHLYVVAGTCLCFCAGTMVLTRSLQPIARLSDSSMTPSPVWHSVRLMWLHYQPAVKSSPSSAWLVQRCTDYMACSCLSSCSIVCACRLAECRCIL
jgi:hypothetical protein